MASVKSVAIYDDYAFGTQRERRYSVVITNNSLVDETVVVGPVVVDVSDDGTAAGAKLLAQLAENELGGEKTAEYQTQAEYDARALGRAMMMTDVDEFYAILPLFLAMETRGGANANARAAYLGTDRPTYDLINDRFSDVQGISFFLDNAKGQIWDELPGEFV